ncbi:MAG: imidazole glycerol phosphate synthase subunit HisH [Cyclobacteriaceae bacterium]|nr:imidazole glycerol phosphate synthase subunit HisH [Cyclobacteriaceae bacterium]MCK5207868.1 imidazole glycerol phosphate synthase subunit HisH [Cyclobacteriaceae bacterium]
MKIVIIKYNAGNVVSVTNTLNRLGVEPVLSDDPEIIKSADKVIFPGVGEASTAMDYLRKRKLDQQILNLKQPFLGICLGQQLMCRYSEENDTDCLGIFDLNVVRFEKKLKVPHMGWNRLFDTKGKLFQGLPDEAYIYFVHSYYCEIGSETIAKSDYINEFSAALNMDNFYAIQGHPEKSGQVGQRLIENFLNL